MACLLSCDTMGMGEDLEAVAARNRDESDASGLGHAQRKRGGRRDGDDVDAPMAAAFCTISMETRLVSTNSPAPAES